MFIFRWEVPEGGFRWVEAHECDWQNPHQSMQAQRERWLTDMIPVGRRYSRRRYGPLEEFPALFRTFADTPVTEEGVLRFANPYGRLGMERSILVPDERPSDRDGVMGSGERLHTWIDQIHAMQRALEIWDALDPPNVSKLQECIRLEHRPSGGVGATYRDNRDGGLFTHLICDSEGEHPDLSDFIRPPDVLRPALFFVQQIVNARLKAHASPSLLYTPEQDRLRLHIEPKNLLGCLWLQFARAIDGNRRYERCRECGRWLEISLDAYRTSRKFCSNACRSKNYRDRNKARGAAYAAKENGA